MEVSKCLKSSIKIKNFRIFYEPETASRLKEIMQPSLDKSFLRLCNLANICRLFHVLAQILFITSEMELDYYHQKVNVSVISQVAKQQKLGNFNKIPEILGYDREYPADHPKAKF